MNHALIGVSFLAFGVVFADSSLAATEEFCGEVKEVLLEAPHFFSSWKQSGSNGVFVSSKLLPHALECSIVIADNNSSVEYICEWPAENPKKGQQVFDQFLRGLESCFPSSKPTIDTQQFTAMFDLGDKQQMYLEFNRFKISVELSITRDR